MEGEDMQVQQFVMAYSADHERIKEQLPEGYTSLRPVLRINAEVRKSETRKSLWMEFVTPVEKDGKKGWYAMARWTSPKTRIDYSEEDGTHTFETVFVKISFTGTGAEGGCPYEPDNQGTFHRGEFYPVETIDENKEFCECKFFWTEPYLPEMLIPKKEILGAYKVTFERAE